MEKVDLTRQFAYRLRDALIAQGYYSSRSTSGVDIHKLVELTGYSPQICRKYLRGEAIPEPSKLVELATRLMVSPGWLLFGDSHADAPHMADMITIRKNLMHYIFMRAKTLYNANIPEQEIPDFLLELMNDVSQINANEAQSKKIIDLALSSVHHFNHDHESR